MQHPDEYENKKCDCPETQASMGCIVSSGYNFEASKKPQFTICDIEILNNQSLSCLTQPPRIFVNSICGNGITESGEDCDCGLETECQNDCCDASTCTLKKGAECARGPCN